MSDASVASARFSTNMERLERAITAYEAGEFRPHPNHLRCPNRHRIGLFHGKRIEDRKRR
jgi:hypothetical protein